MKKYLVLYWKEVKNLSGGLLFILVFSIGSIVLMYFILESSVLTRHSPFEILLMNLGNISFYLFPALLLYSLYMEEKTGTHYQVYSFPVKRYRLLLNKFLVLLGAMVLMTIVIAAFGFLIGRGDPMVIIGYLLELFCSPFICLSLVCAAWGITQLIKRNRLVLGLAVVVVGYGIYMWLRLTYYHLFIFGIGGAFSCIGFYFYGKYGEV